MRLFGFDISRRRKKASASAMSPVGGSGRWFNLFGDIPHTGAWQQDVQIQPATVLVNWALYACVTLIAQDIGKLRMLLVEKTDADIWIETASPAFSPVLRKPNRYQTWQKFIEQWIVSKLIYGNAYVLKQRDQRGVVVAMYVLDANLVTPLVAPDGSVYYQLREDTLSQVPSDLPAVPAAEMIHDTMVCLFHPLVGVSPITACGLAAMQGLKIQRNSERFFTNMSRPSGLLIAPEAISPETQAALKQKWEDNYSGDKVGRVAVLGDGLKFESLGVNAVDAQMVEQLKMTAEMVCTTFHVPAFKIGAGVIPAGQKVEDLNQIYYSDCLQALMESIEALLDEGLGLTEAKDGRRYGTMFDLTDLLKMDASTQAATLKTLVDGSIMAPDEGRQRLNLAPVPGGASPLSQQQNYSLAALAKRDAKDDPFGKAGAPAAPPSAGDTAKAVAEAIAPHVARLEAMLDAVKAAQAEAQERAEAALFAAAVARKFADAPLVA